MNYLAHLLISPRTPLALGGALAGDFLHGKLDESLPAPFREGVVLHRAVDAFADSHPALRASRGRLSELRHHARIIVDVFYDHFLAVQFEKWSGGESLAAFTSEAYEKLLRNVELFPPRMQRVVRAMAADDWLTSYAEIDSIESALFYLSRRLKRHVDLSASVARLKDDYDGFRGDFERFMPELIDFVRSR